MIASITRMRPRREVPVIKAIAAYALWQTRRFTSMEISAALEIHEADVVRIVDAARDAERSERDE